MTLYPSLHHLPRESIITINQTASEVTQAEHIKSEGTKAGSPIRQSSNRQEIRTFPLAGSDEHGVSDHVLQVVNHSVRPKGDVSFPSTVLRFQISKRPGSKVLVTTVFERSHLVYLRRHGQILVAATEII